MKVLILHAHPDNNSIIHKIFERISEGLIDAGHKTEKVDLYDLNLGIIKKSGDTDIIKKLQEQIKNTDSIVMVYPVWWYNMPAIVKNIFDRVFEGGFAFETKTKTYNVPFLKSYNFETKSGLLKNIQKVMIVNTAETPLLIRKFVYKDNSFANAKNGIFKVIGAKKITHKTFKTSKSLKDTEIESVLKGAYELGKTFKE